MQTVALKPRKAEWKAIVIGLAILCGAMLAVPLLCLPLAIAAPLLACPLVGRREEPAAWLSAAMPAISSLLAGVDAYYALSLLLIGLLPLLATRFIPIPKRPGAVGIVLYISAMAFSLLVVLCMAMRMLGGPLPEVLPQLIVQKLAETDDLSELLARLAARGLVSVPDGYTASGVIRPLMQETYNREMLLSLRLTLELLIRGYLPRLFVNACLLVGLFTSLRLERMNGVLLVVEAKTANHKRARVVAAPSFRLLAVPRQVVGDLLVIMAVSLAFHLAGESLGTAVMDLCFCILEAIYSLLGAAVLVFLFTKNDPERRVTAGILAAAVYLAAPFVLILTGLLDQMMHFRNPKAPKPD